MRRNAVLSVLVACLVLASCAPGQGGPLATEVAVQATTFAAPDAATAAPPTPFVPLPPTATPRPGRLVGVLLGTDWDPLHPERVAFGIRTDVFVVYVIDEAYDPVRVTLIALPRDLWVGIPPGACQTAGTLDRINAAWGVWGIPLDNTDDSSTQFGCVADVVQHNLGLTVNAPIAVVEMRGFVALVDRIGGVTITPTEDYTDFCGDILGTEGDGGEWRTWKAGRSYSLRGNEALCYVRGRRVAIGDLDRNRRALEVIRAIRETVFATTAGYVEGLWTFVEFGRDYVDLGLPGPSPFAGGADNVVSLIWHLLPLAVELGDADLRMIRLGTDQTAFWTTPRGASVVVATINLPAWLVCVMALDDVDGCTERHPRSTADLQTVTFGDLP